jgi:bis(5'-nucleosyl)-tetraphosphatase (symmetrical)
MATYIVGDIHGWLNVFERLFERLEFDWSRDCLWLAGDLVNRGPDSLGTLRRARALERELGPRFVAILGNHDLNLLAQAAGLKKRSPELEALLRAPDIDELLEWLARRPLAHFEYETLLVHAGIWPSWCIADALAWARQLEALLSNSERRSELLHAGRKTELERALFALTNMRLLDRDLGPCDFKGKPEAAPRGCRPWFDLPERRWRGEARVVFGHWAALGLFKNDEVIGLDSGCSWGFHLSALRLEDLKIFQEPNPDALRRPQL